MEAIRGGIADGTVDAIATDHAPHAADLKAKPLDAGAPFGIIGLETALGLALTKLVDSGVLPVEEVLRKMTEAPARIMAMERWGYSSAIDEGQNANLVLIDPEERWTVDPASFESRSKNTPFGGWELKGKAKSVLFGGNFVMRDCQVVEGWAVESPDRGAGKTGTAGARKPIAQAAKAGDAR